MNFQGKPIIVLLTLSMVLLAGCSFPGMIPEGHALPPARSTATATPLPALVFPQDEAPHHDLTEWWYYTGHLVGTDATGAAHTYGFELTFFQILRSTFGPLYIGHVAVTDLTRQQFASAQQTQQLISIVPASTPGFDLSIGAWNMHGLAGHDHLTAGNPDYHFALDLLTQKAAPVLHNGNGLLTTFGPGFSYYYSRTRMAVQGTVLDHGVPLTVTGTAWMDHQWGNFLLDPSISWQWFSLQLADNTEYMLFFLATPVNGQRVYGATRIAANGTVTALTTGLSEEVLNMWTSPTTHTTYPAQWRVTVPGGDLTVTPLLANQEFVTPANSLLHTAYWEGDCAVSGMIDSQPMTGASYVEITNFG